MPYVTVEIDDGEGDIISIDSDRYPIDFVAGSPMTDPNVAPVATRVRTSRYTGKGRRRIFVTPSPRQDALTPGNSSRTRGPKTRGDTNEFINAFWVKGKPKCREGYRYDFSRKMCRLIK